MIQISARPRRPIRRRPPCGNQQSFDFSTYAPSPACRICGKGEGTKVFCFPQGGRRLFFKTEVLALPRILLSSRRSRCLAPPPHKLHAFLNPSRHPPEADDRSSPCPVQTRDAPSCSKHKTETFQHSSARTESTVLRLGASMDAVERDTSNDGRSPILLEYRRHVRGRLRDGRDQGGEA